MAIIIYQEGKTIGRMECAQRHLNAFNPNKDYYNWDELETIHFSFNKTGKGKNPFYKLQDIICYDIEASNGYQQADGTIVPWNPETAKVSMTPYDNGTPLTLHYHWQVAIDSIQDGKIYVFMGRTYPEFRAFLDRLEAEIKYQTVCSIPSSGNRYADRDRKFYDKNPRNLDIPFFVHNLGYEFQHLRNLFEADWSTVDVYTDKKGRTKTIRPVFARSAWKPMKAALNRTGKCKIIFRDTVCLTQKSLDSWCKDADLPIKKQHEPKGFYDPIRTPATPLTDEEREYCYNDVVCMCYGMRLYRDTYKTLENIPMTQTGTVRRKCYQRICWTNNGNKKQATEWAKHCAKQTSRYTFRFFTETLLVLFAGGWTHCNARLQGRLLKNVICFDVASFYPSVMTTRTFPIGDAEEVSPEEYDSLLAQDLWDLDLEYHYDIHFRVKGLHSRKQNSFASVSKALSLSGATEDNGRVSDADEAEYKLTDLDFDIFRRAYRYDSLEILGMHKYKSGLLPKEIICLILEYYHNKTKLKGMGQDSLYNESKQFINSIYGVAVTKLITDEHFFFEGWKKKPITEKEFAQEMKDQDPLSSFLSYQLGVWVTAWARHGLWEAILKLDKHVAYCDTDSIKGIFTQAEVEWVETVWNKKIRDREAEICARLNLDPEIYSPVSPKGKVCTIGIFEREDDAVEFKALRAKCYVATHWSPVKDQDDTLKGWKKVPELTLAGLPKKAGKAKIKKADDLKDGVKWEPWESEKLCMCYNVNQPENQKWVDYMGHEYVSNDKFGACLKPVSFDNNLSGNYVKFLESLKKMNQGVMSDITDKGITEILLDNPASL